MSSSRRSKKSGPAVPSRPGRLGAPAPSSGRFVNSGTGLTLQPIDIGHADYCAVVDPDTAFWALVRRGRLADAIASGGPRSSNGKGKTGRAGSASDLAAKALSQRAKFAREMETLRFGLTPSAVYFNPTERCNLDCKYCYIPQRMRSTGSHMSAAKLLDALSLLKAHFAATLPKGQKPQVIFHGAEPLLNRDAVFAGIEEFGRDFRFGVQTNGTLLDDSAVKFLTQRNVSIGLSLDGPTAEVAGRTRANWAGEGIFNQVVEAIDKLRGYHAWSVICTVTKSNLPRLTELVDFFHGHEVPTCMLNIVRCTLPAARRVKPDDASAATAFLAAMDRTYELFRRTGRKMVVANFANILLAILAPSARRLMCDISPCGGGRCFVALAPNGDLFPCSEFIGLPEFRGGNLFADRLGDVLASPAFVKVTGRRVEDIQPCARCAIRHFCGSPCPAEAHEMNGGMDRTGAFCEFYEEQVRYAFRLIADGKHEAFLWDGWDKGMRTSFDFA